MRKAAERKSPEVEKLLEMLRWMVLSRRFEEKSAEAYQTGKIGGFCHLYIGQEAVAVAIRPRTPLTNVGESSVDSSLASLTRAIFV